MGNLPLLTRGKLAGVHLFQKIFSKKFLIINSSINIANFMVTQNQSVLPPTRLDELNADTNSLMMTDQSNRSYWSKKIFWDTGYSILRVHCMDAHGTKDFVEKCKKETFYVLVQEPGRN